MIIDAYDVQLINKTLTVADTEYSQAIPENTKFIHIQCRTAYDVRFAFETGKVAGSVANFSTIKSGGSYSVERTLLKSKTIYLASSQAGVVVELICGV